MLPDEITATFQNAAAECFTATNLINQFDLYQECFPEEIWRLDIQRKYIRTFTGESVDNSIPKSDVQYLRDMMQGRKKYQRRQWARDQELYFGTMNLMNSIVGDNNRITFRCFTPTGDNIAVKPDYTLKIVPYSDMYLSVMFGNGGVQQKRAKAGVEYTIECPLSTMDDTQITIYGANGIQALSDLSACYIAANNFSMATKLRKLVVGNTTEGYNNSRLVSLTLGSNKLLEELDIRNCGNLTGSLNLAQCNNLLRLYAEGTKITGVTFATNGKIQTAHLPDTINTLTMRNLNDLTDFNATLNQLENLTLQGGTVDSLDVVNRSIDTLRVLYLYDINWALTNAGLLDSILSLFYASLTGKIHVPEIKQQRMYDYLEAWPDLEISYDSMVEQFVVTFKNDNGAILETQYVDIGRDAIDPTIREDNPIHPTKESTVSHDYTFAGWDKSLEDVFSDRTIIATYTSELREYSIRYVSMNSVQQESTGKYGEYVPYVGNTPTYTAGEDASYTYYLFNRWDKSGYIDGDKVVNAIFDKFVYTESAFAGKTLADMKPVELYALTKLRQKFGIVNGVDEGINFVNSIVSDGDKYEFSMGFDIDYDDISSQVIVKDGVGFDGTSTVFDGTRGWDTGIKLFETDRDFVLAIDYKFDSTNNSGDVLAQCYQTNGSIGFKLGYNGSNVTATWATSNNTLTSLGNREMVVIRHVAGSNNVTVYNSALNNTVISTFELSGTDRKICDSTLMFGAGKADDGVYFGHTSGTIYWCKLWEKDLGDDICRNLAMWTHEAIKLSACGTRRYALSENPTQMCTLTFLADQLLDRTMAWNTASGNTGGWASSTLNERLNDRFYSAIPSQIKLIIKQVEIPSSVGNGSTDVSTSNCYIAIPSLRELFPSGQTKYVNTSDAPYASEGETISYMSNNAARIRTRDDNIAIDYWTRSPHTGSSGTYVFRVDSTGANQAYEPTSTSRGVLVMMSI